MFYSHTGKSQPSQVTVKFGDGTNSFQLEAGTTLAELASRISVLGAQHNGAPISIDIQFERRTKLNARSQPLHLH